MNRLKEKFLKEVSPALMSKFEYNISYAST